MFDLVILKFEGVVRRRNLVWGKGDVDFSIRFSVKEIIFTRLDTVLLYLPSGIISFLFTSLSIGHGDSGIGRWNEYTKEWIG